MSNNAFNSNFIACSVLVIILFINNFHFNNAAPANQENEETCGYAVKFFVDFNFIFLLKLFIKSCSYK